MIVAWFRDFLRLDVGVVVEDHVLASQIADAERDRDAQFAQMRAVREDMTRHSVELERIGNDLDAADAMMRKALSDDDTSDAPEEAREEVGSE